MTALDHFDRLVTRGCARWLSAGCAVGLLLAVWFSVLAPGTQARKHPTAREPRVLAVHPVFHDTGLAVGDVWTSGRYTFVTPPIVPLPTGGLLGTLIDGQTGKRTVISRTGCGISLGTQKVGGRLPAPIGGPWLLFFCASAAVPQGYVALYGLASGQWQDLAIAPRIEAFQNLCEGQAGCGAPAIAVGSDWVEFVEQCYHCVNTYVFQNIGTGQAANDPTDATTIVDLNAPTLAQKICRPLGAQPGMLSFYGSFAVSNQDPRVYLERCGTQLHKPIDPNVDQLTANAHLVLWRSSSTRLSGLFLPSLRRVTVEIPSRIGNLIRLVISTRSLEVINSNGELWTTPIPMLPRPRPHPPRR